MYLCALLRLRQCQCDTTCTLSLSGYLYFTLSQDCFFDAGTINSELQENWTRLNIYIFLRCFCTISSNVSPTAVGRKRSWRDRWIEGEQRRSTKRRPKRNIWLRSMSHKHAHINIHLLQLCFDTNRHSYTYFVWCFLQLDLSDLPQTHLSSTLSVCVFPGRRLRSISLMSMKSSRT